MYIGETGRSLKTRKKEHTNAVKNFDFDKSAFCEHVVNFDHTIKHGTKQKFKKWNQIFKDDELQKVFSSINGQKN